jgi:geranylgeranyl pyrophosphate synthase
MALFRDTANIVLGTALIFIAFQLLLAVGTWRWTAWDERERVETQRRRYRPTTNGAVAVQMTIHTAAALLLYAAIVHSDYAVLSVPMIALAILMTGAAVVIGIGIDVVSANQRRDGERVARLIRAR